jgi:uroporphyrinogen decarboxylase
MTHRERIMAALKHQAPDRVPIDLGGTGASTISIRALERLRACLNMPPDPPPVVYSKRSATALPDDAIVERFGIDTRPARPGSPDVAAEREIDANTLVDEWGVAWRRAPGGHFISANGPFQHLADPTPRDVEGFRWPDPSDPGYFRGFRERVRKLHEETDRAVILNLQNGPVHQSQYMRGYAEWLEDLLLRPEFVTALAERITDLWLELNTRILEETKDYIDLVSFGDDIATQRAPLMRPELYRTLIKPYHRRMAAAIKRFDKPILYHSCGAVSRLIPDLLDVGIDALNPVQVAAGGMDTKRLKQEYGRDLAFWGGIDTQHVLPLGTPADVREEVKRWIEDLSENGGYVLCPVHNVQPEVPPENLIAMFEAAMEYGRV